jgi:hypothetical protein
VDGAYVKANCQYTTTDHKEYRLTVRSGGQYKVIARFEDVRRGIVAYGEKTTDAIAPGATVHADITVLEPPECLRNVVVEGTVRVDDVYFSGADHDEKHFLTTLHVQYGVASFDQMRGQWVIDPNDGASRRTDVAQVGASVGDSDGELKIEITALSDLSVDVRVTGTIADLNDARFVNVPQRAVRTIPEFDLDTGGPFNDRAYFRDLTINNRDASAI